MFLIKGLILGFIICAPIGPIGLLCVRRAIIDGRVAGMIAVLGASTVDALYCAIAGFGITYISTFLTHEHVYLQIAGGLVLVLVGLRIFNSMPPERVPEPTGHSLFSSFISAFFIMLSNPLPILVFTATLTALGVHGWRDAYAATGFLVGGVFAGSALWAPILAATVSSFTPRLTPWHLRMANRIAGIILMGFGAVVSIVALFG